MEFMRVPAGKFLMGSIYDNSDDKPQSLVDIPYDYWMARYPVTNAFYNAYAKSKGIKHPVDGWEKKKHHPATLISWTDATAYCQWLNSLLEAELASSLVSRLPTEAEWEKAARGTDGREYPWGNKFDKAKCNVAPNFFSMIGGLFVDSITPVNQFSPQGDSPYGCADMIGNVSEYTNSLFNENPYTTSSQPGSLTNHIVARGGSYLRGARCTLREKADINSVMIGFRVCIAPPLPK
jgi:formylglycine-generating enzyme required for sulfatase activity